MDPQHQKLFRSRLHMLMSGLTISQSDPNLIGIIGTAGSKLLNDTKTQSWAQFKSTLAPESYDRVLEALQKGGSEARAAGRPLGVRGFEAIGVALIARHQTDTDLAPVAAMLDDYIEKCITAVRNMKPRRASAKASRQ